jgi:hypothetical protein
MSDIGIQDAALVLGELQEDERYKALSEESEDSRFNQFRQAVELAQIRCLAMYPPNKSTEPEIRGLLDALQAECTGTLAPFRPYFDRAIPGLDK